MNNYGLNHEQPISSQRTSAWFTGASFGLFIHFDQASQLGVDLSWPMVGMTSDDGLGAHSREPVDYLSKADQFDPLQWDPVSIAEAARAAGMTYAVFTTKHHSGWAAWPSKATPLSVATSPFGARGGDLVRDFVAAFRAVGLRIGLYYSVSDWSDPDYPAWRPEFAPYSFESYPRPSKDQWDRYREGLKEELYELLTWYGPIDALWFDGGWERTSDEWGSEELEAHIRELQPDILLNDRLPGVGNFVTPEQSTPSSKLNGPWEACITMNNTWGWDPADLDYKSARSIAQALVECVSNGGALLLNVGPDSTGQLTEQEAAILAEISEWMRAHKPSVIGAGTGLEPWQFYGPTTSRGSDIYLHLVAWPDEEVVVRGIRPHEVEYAEMLETGEKLALTPVIDATVSRQVNPVGNLHIKMPERRPDCLLPVILLRFRD